MRTLLAIAVVFVLAGCASEASPLPNIEATVEARLELAKASLVAPKEVPLPTYTPMPAPSPEVVVKEVVVEKEVIKEVEVPVIVEVEVIKEVVVEKVVEVEVVVTATPTATPIPATEAVIVGWKTVDDVVSALDKHTLSERTDKVFDLVLATDGAGFEVNPGGYYLEFYVYEYESNIAAGMVLLENLWRGFGLTEAQVEELVAGLVVENNILLLPIDETFLELLLADLRD